MNARLALLCSALVGCGSTGGQLIQLPFRLGGATALASPLTTSQGWQVSDAAARIALGPFYLNVASPPTDAFRGGVVIAQVTSQVIINPFDSTLIDVMGGADGETGTAVAAEIDLLPPDATQSADDLSVLDGNVGVLSGTATRNDVSFRFAGPIAIDQSLATPQQPLQSLERVNGALVDLVFTESPAVLELRVDPTAWFDRADFSSLAETDPPGGVRTWGLKSTFLRQLLSGVQQTVGVYEFTLAEAKP